MVLRRMRTFPTRPMRKRQYRTMDDRRLWQENVLQFCWRESDEIGIGMRTGWGNEPSTSGVGIPPPVSESPEPTHCTSTVLNAGRVSSSSPPPHQSPTPPPSFALTVLIRTLSYRASIWCRGRHHQANSRTILLCKCSAVQRSAAQCCVIV